MVPKRIGLIAIMIGLGLFAPAISVAQDTGTKKPPTQLGAGQITNAESIEAAFKGNDNFQVQQAVDAAITLLADEKASPSAIGKLPGWFRILDGEKRFDEIEDIAVGVINAQPHTLSLIEICQEARIRARLLANKPKEGLALAKGYYNVCAMQDTSKAIGLIAECLYDINSDNDPAGAVRKFKLQQIHGAATTQPSASGDDNLLASVTVDCKCYEEGLKQVELSDDQWKGLLGKGNLLLLSDKPREAQKAFDKAYSLASDKNLAAATEAVARAMRAEDGAVGRANAWILSLRPADDTTAGQ